MECVICYNEIAKDAGYNKWNCSHSFHKNCTKRWNKSCPICRCKDKNKDLLHKNAAKAHKNTAIAVLRGHTKDVNCLTINENKLYTGSNDNTIRIWNTETHEEIATLRGHTCGVLCLTLHENKLYSGSYDKTIRIWNTETHEEIAILRGHNGSVDCLTLHDNKLISGSGWPDNNIRVWNTNTHKCITTLRGVDTKQLNCLIVHENKLFSGGYDKTIRIWNPVTCEKSFWNIDNLLDLIISESFWTTETYETIATLEGHVGAVTCLAVYENKLYSGSHDDSISVWNTETHEEIEDFRWDRGTHTPSVSCITHHDNKMYSGHGGPIRIWNTETCETIGFLRGHGRGSVNCLAVYENKLYSGSSDATIRVWNV